MGCWGVCVRRGACPDRCRRCHRWIAVHVIDFYNDISLLYGTIAELCTQVTCPIMSAGTHRYLWADGVTFTTPIKVPAKEYVHYCIS